MPTTEECQAVYHCGIADILTAAYQRELTMQEMGKCKTKFPTFDDWYVTLSTDQLDRVDKVLNVKFGPLQSPLF